MDSSGYRDVDVVLTTRELAYLIKDMGIDFKNLREENLIVLWVVIVELELSLVLLVELWKLL